MSVKKNIFSLELLQMRQERARKIGFVDYLDKFVMDQITERLAEINRKFKSPAIIGGKANFWADYLGIPNAKLISDRENLDLGYETHDLVIHALSLHWHNDPVGQLIQVRNALKPDGLMLAFLCGGNTLGELRTAFQKAEISNEDGMSPRVAPMVELKKAGDLLVRAGFALNVADSLDLIVSYDSPLELLYDLRRMGETNIMVERRRKFLNRKTFQKCMDIYAQDFNDEGDTKRIKATFQIFCLTGWRPAENQQKPLKPGSAQKNFSEVLKPYELKRDKKNYTV